MRAKEGERRVNAMTGIPIWLAAWASARVCVSSFLLLSTSKDTQTKINSWRWPNRNCGPRGGTQEAKPGSGVQRFWGPLGASEFDPSFRQFGVSETASQGPLRAPERLSGAPGRLFRGLGEGYPFSTEREKKVGHSEASKRSRFPGCPRRGVQPSGLLPSGHRQQ